jgi:hypothetical protein
MSYKIVYTLSGSGHSISATDSMTASLSFTGLQYSFIDGYLGHYTIPIPDDSINVGILNKSVIANVKLLDPRLHITFLSSFGLNVSAQLDSVYGYSTGGGIDTIIIPPMIDTGESAIGQPPRLSRYTIDSTNSNLRNILSPVPNYFIFNGHFTINPSASTYNFLTDTSSITLNVDAELPACFKIIQLALQDTVQLLLPPDTTILTYANFALQVTNAFPVYASVQMYFTDSNYVILDSLINPANAPSPYYVVNQAPITPQGIVNGTTVQETKFSLERTRYTAMASRVRHGLVRGNLYTSGMGYIQLFSSNHIDIKTAVMFSLNYNL